MKKRRVLIIFASLMVLTIAAGAIFIYQALNYKSSLISSEKKNSGINSEKVTEEGISYKDDINAPTSIINILFLGVDQSEERDLGVYRSDIIAVARINMDTNKVNVLSIPRDTYTYIPVEGKNDKINHAYAYGTIDGNAVQASIDAVNQFIGTEFIDYYFVIDMDPIPYIVDEIGGVKIDVDTEMYDPDFNVGIEKGMQVLNGKQAVLYLQWRYSQGGDIDRIKHVQNFMGTLFNQQRYSGKMLDTLKIILKCSDSIQTDFSKKQLIAFAAFANQLPDGCIAFYTLSGNCKTIDGISYWVPDDNTEMINNFLQ